MVLQTHLVRLVVEAVVYLHHVAVDFQNVVMGVLQGARPVEGLSNGIAAPFLGRQFQTGEDPHLLLELCVKSLRRRD